LPESGVVGFQGPFMSGNSLETLAVGATSLLRGCASARACAR
jgi:hypothetical protein